MNNKDIFIAAIILGSLLAFFVSLKVRKIPISGNVGGCSGTRYGCCPNSTDSCIDKICSNCYTPSHHRRHHHHHHGDHPHPRPPFPGPPGPRPGPRPGPPPPHPRPHPNLIGGCKGTRYGCCPDSRKACSDEDCSNC